MPSAPQVCIKPVRLCVLAAAAAGAEPQRLLGEYGLTTEQLADPYLRVPHALLARMWDEVPRRLPIPDEAFGLHAAEQLHRQAHDAMDAAVFQGRTVRGVFELLARYARLHHEGAVIELTPDGELMWCSERFDCSPPMPRHFVELVLAMWVLRLRALFRPTLRIRQVAFTHAAPRELGEHQRILGPNLCFAADCNGIALEQAELDVELPRPQPVLGVVIERHLRDELERLPPADDFLDSVSRAIRESLVETAALDLPRLCRRLGTSRRTLQRRMQAAGTSIQAQLDRARRELVLKNLRDPRLTLADLAYLAGFAEIRAFYRAFRRWTGQTPSEYCRRAQAGT